MNKEVSVRPKVAKIACLLFLLIAPAVGSAANFYYFYNDAGASPASSPSESPVAVQFEDVAPGVVNVTVTSGNLTGSEFLRRLRLNLSPDINPADLDISLIESSEDLGGIKIAQKSNKRYVKGAGGFDIGIRFGNGKDVRFDADDYAVFQISGVPGLSVADFEEQSFPREDDEVYFSAVQVKPGGSEGRKGWMFTEQGAVPVPEPSSSLLLALAAGVSFLARRASRVNRGK